MEFIAKELQAAKELLEKVLADKNILESIKKAGAVMSNALKEGNKIISCGNGGSMSDAIHFAEELSGRYRNDRKPLAAIAISDAAHITCTANDYGFDQIFSRFIGALGQQGDCLLALTTSGNSANIIEAIKQAKKQNITTIVLTGNSGGLAGTLADVEIRVPHTGYSDRIQEIHIKIIHILISLVENNLKL